MICTGRPFFVGEEVSLAFLHPVSQEHFRITGEIVWVASQGIGVKFKSIAPEDKELDLYDSKTDQEKSIRVKEEVRKMGKVKKRRIRWQPSASRDVTSYRLYWSNFGEVSYDSDHAEFGNVTEVVLPDDVSSFALYSGDITLGVSSVNAAGNESDITKITAHFNFDVPDAPKDLEVEDM